MASIHHRENDVLLNNIRDRKISVSIPKNQHPAGIEHDRSNKTTSKSNVLSLRSSRCTSQSTKNWRFLEKRRESYLNSLFNKRKQSLFRINKENLLIYRKINQQYSQYAQNNCISEKTCKILDPCQEQERLILQKKWEEQQAKAARLSQLLQRKKGKTEMYCGNTYKISRMHTYCHTEQAESTSQSKNSINIQEQEVPPRKPLAAISTRNHSNRINNNRFQAIKAHRLNSMCVVKSQVDHIQVQRKSQMPPIKSLMTDIITF